MQNYDRTLFFCYKLFEHTNKVVPKLADRKERKQLYVEKVKHRHRESSKQMDDERKGKKQ